MCLGGGDSSPCVCAALADANSDVCEDTRTQRSYRSFHYRRKGQLGSLLETPQSTSAMSMITRTLTFQFSALISKDKTPVKPFPRLMKMNVLLLPPVYRQPCAYSDRCGVKQSARPNYSPLFSCSPAKLQSCCSNRVPPLSNFCIILFFLRLCRRTDSAAHKSCSGRPPR